MYDFDKTLSTKDMQEYTFIPKLGMSAEIFWKKADKLAGEQGMDRILAYMKLMLDESRRHEQSIRRSDFVSLGGSLEFFPGVLSWFDEVNKLGSSMGLDIQHFIISSGLREIIEALPSGNSSNVSMRVSISMMRTGLPLGLSYRSTIQPRHSSCSGSIKGCLMCMRMVP